MLKDFKIVKNQLFNSELPMHSPLFELCESCCTVLENEKTTYRPVDSNGNAGGLIDFSDNSLPTIIVPDIHARPAFIYNILNYKLPQTIIDYSDRSVFHALKKGLIRIICVGDALHTEKNYNRWKQIQIEFNAGIHTGPAMNLEMNEGLNTVCALMMLKKLFPEHVHFLKGNHENIMNKSGDGDYGFRKYADEGNMVRQFIFDMYGDDILYLISCIEKNLPLVALNKNFVISHGEPRKSYTKKEIINARCEKNIVSDFTWTDNNQAEDGSVEQIIKNLSGFTDVNGWYYFGGHRPVPYDYLERQNGKYIQIHNPAKQNIVFIKPDEPIVLEKNIVHLDKKSKKNS